MSASTEGRRRGRYLFSRVALIFFGFLILVAMELGLRLVWEPAVDSDRTFIETAIDPYQVKEGWATTREEFLGPFRKSRFSERKPEGVIRIFCLGASSTMGYPFPARAAWPARLEIRLKALYPGLKIEVINAGGTSYGSSRTLGVLRGILKYEPDIVVVYGGGTDFVEDSYRTSVRRTFPKGFIDRLYIARLIRKIIPRNSDKYSFTFGDELSGDKGVGGFLFSPVLDGTVYRPDEDARVKVRERFRANMESLVSTSMDHGVRIILCTVPSNIRSWPPDPDETISIDRKDAARWRGLVEQAVYLQESGDLPAALKFFGDAAGVWGGNARFNYEFGRALLLAGKTEAAGDYLTRARDLDPGPVRATTGINDLIREVSRERNVPLADLVEAFSSLSPHGITGGELILDYAHPTEEGHAVVERVVWDALRDTVPGWDAYSRDMEREISNAPVERFEPQLDVNLSFVWGQIYARKGFLERAEKMFRRTVKLDPGHIYAALNLANILMETGRFHEAVPMLEKVVAKRPVFVEPYASLATAYYRSGDLVRASRHYRRAMEMGDHRAVVYRGLVGTLVDSGMAADAVETAGDGLARYPGDCYLTANLGRAYEIEGAGGKAESIYLQFLESDPGCSLVSENLGLLQVEDGRLEAAAETFEKAISQPGSPHALHHLNLGQVYLRMGRMDDAAARFSEYYRMEPGGLHRIPAQFRERVTGRAESN